MTTKKSVNYVVAQIFINTVEEEENVMPVEKHIELRTALR